MVELVKELTETAKKVGQPHPHGTVVHLQLCVKHMEPMKPVPSARALENRGLEGDRHAMPDSSRQVLLFEQETCQEFDFPIGALRENITTRGIDLMSLPHKTRLQIGDAVFETTKPCAPCSFVDGVKPGLREALAERRGMLARVVQGGEIRVGSKISVLEK
jgi:MOSC domain-containing protein YiiM